jgi:hypothetical protein
VIAKEEVTVVVAGLLTEVIVIGTLLPPPTATAFMFTSTEELLKMEQVELMLQEHPVDPVKEIWLGMITIIFEPATNAFTVVKETVTVDTIPMEELDMEAEAVAMGETTEVSDTVVVSIE